MIRLEKISKKFLNKEKKYSNRLLIKKLLTSVFTSEKKTGKPASDGFWALDNISFRIDKGEHVGIIGNNKAGKTTLLQIISGITEPTSGELSVDGNVVQLFAQGTMYTSDLTGREYIILHASALGFPKEMIDEKIEQIIEFSEIDQINSLVKFYSTGMHARLSLSIVLHLPADIYIFDEGFLGSDIFFKEKVKKALREIVKGTDKIILFVSHNEDLLKSFCNRLILLDRGKILKDGAVAEVWDYYAAMHKHEKAITDKTD